MAKPWEIDFGDVEKALGLGQQEGPPAPTPSPALTGDKDRYDAVTQAPTPALTGDTNRYDGFDQVAQQLGINAAINTVQQPSPLGDVTALDTPTQQQQPTTTYQAPTVWDQVATDLSSNKPVDSIQLSTPPVDTGPAQFTQAQQPVNTVSTVLTGDSSNGQKRVDSAGQAPAGGVFDTIGNAIIAAPAAIGSTPGYRAATQRAEDNLKSYTNNDQEAMSPIESVKAGGWSALNMLGLGADAVKTTEIPGTDLTVGQIAKTLVGSSDKTYNDPTFGQQLGHWWNDVQSELGKWQGINRQISTLPDTVKPDASMALLNVYSGYDTVQSTLSDILNKDTNVASIAQRANDAQAAGDALKAAELGAQAVKLRDTSAVELVDNKTSLLPELGYTLVLDPLNAISEVFKLAGHTPEGIRAAGAAKLFDVTPAEALAKIPAAVEDAAVAAGIVEKGGSLFGMWDKINPFARTPEALAAKDNNILYRMAAALFGDVSTKQDARQIVTALVDAPETLIHGLTNATSEGLANRADSLGRVAFDAGVVANDEVLRALPVIKLAADRLVNMASHAGDGLLNKTEFISEFDNIINDAARRAYGLDKLIDLPVGTKTAEIVREGKNAFVRFLDSGGREAGRTAAMTVEAAKTKLADLNKTISTTNNNFNLIKNAAQAQRAIMSEIWLNMRPSHWVTNAVSAYTHLFVDGLYTFKKTDEIVNELTKLSGEILPSQRIRAAVAGEEAVQSIFRKIPIVGSILGAWSEAGAGIKGGKMALFDRLAVGEQNFYMRAYYSAFRRVFDKQWESTVSRELGQVFQRLGVDPAVSKELISVATEAALRGGKQEMINEFRRAVNAVQTSFTLDKLGIRATDITPDGQRALHELFRAGPGSVQDAIAGVNKIFRDEAMRWQQILKQSAPEPARYAWTTLEHLNDAADITDDLGRAAKLGGVDAGNVPQQLANTVTQVEQQIYNSLFYELGGSTDPRHLNAAIDMWGQLHDAKQMVRERLGALADQTIRDGSDRAWANYFQAARQEWDNYAKQAQSIGDATRTAITNNTPAALQWDGWEMIQAYAQADEQALLQLRGQGFDIGKAADQPTRFQRVLDAQRQYVDGYVGQAFGMFQRYQSLDSLDIVVSAQRDADRLGARAAAYVGDARDRLFANEISVEEFYKIRNQTWYELADAQASRWQVATREMIFNGEKEKFPTKLRFTDNFAGGDFELLRSQKQGEQTFWYAKRLDDGTVHRFGDPMDKNVGLPPVPQSVVNDYNRMMGELDKLVDTVAESVKPVEHVPLAKVDGLTATEKTQLGPLFNPANADQVQGGLPPMATQYNATTGPTGSVTDIQRGTIADIQAAKQDMLKMWDDAAAHFEAMPSVNELTMRLGIRNGGGTPDIKINGVRWDDSAIVQEFAQKMFGPNGTGEDLLAWLRDYSNLSRQADQAGAAIKDANQFKGMDAKQILDNVGTLLDSETVQMLRDSNATREEVLNMIESAQGHDPEMRYYNYSQPALDIAALEKKWAEAANVDLSAYKIDPKKQLEKWFNITGDGIKDLYKSVVETNNGRAALGGTWQPGMGDYADYMMRQTEAARRKIIQNVEEIMRGGPNLLSPEQRLRAFDGLVAIARSYDGALGTAAKAANDMADFAMLNFADRRNIDNIIGLWTPYHYWFTRSAKNWIERSVMKPSLLADYYKFQRAGDLYAQQNNLPDRLVGRIPIWKSGDTTYFIPNPVDIMLPYNVYGLKGFDDPTTANNGFERAYMYAQMLGFGALPVYDAAIKYASGKGADIQIGDYIPQYRAINYIYQGITGQSLPSAGDQYDPYRTGRQAGIEAIRGNTSPTLAQWAQDIAYQTLLSVGALPEQPKEAQAVYEAAAKAAGWDRSLAVLGSYFLGLGVYTYTDAEKAAREAGQKYRDVGYSETGNVWGSKAAKNAVMDQSSWLPAWWSRSSVAPADSKSSDGSTVRPGAQASFNEMSQAKDQLNAQQNQQIDAYIMQEMGKGTPLQDIQKGVWALIGQYSDQRKAIEAAHPSAAIPSSKTPYNGYNPQELGAKAYELAVQKAKEQMGDLPAYPANGTKEEKAAWAKARDAYNAQLQNLVQGYMSDPSSLVNGGKVDVSKLPTDPAEVIKLYDQRYMTPIQKQLANAVAAEKAAKAQEYAKNNSLWNEYNNLDYEGKKKFLAEHPEFAKFLASHYKSRGLSAPWQGGHSGGGHGGGNRRTGRALNGNVSYSSLFPSIAAWAQRTPKAPGVQNTINPVLWKDTGRRYAGN